MNKIIRTKTPEGFPRTTVMREKILKTYIWRFVVKYRNFSNLQDPLTELENSRLSRKTGKYLCQSSGTGRLKRGEKGRNRGELRENERIGGKRKRGRCDEGMEGTGEN